MLERNRVHCLDVLEGLRKLEDDSVDMIFTSPPYWRIRDFGREAESVWGGDPSCDHIWEDISVKRSSQDASGGSTCGRCGAWRGQLGLEPNVPLFLEHLLMVFDEVRKVLRRDGTCWVNLGDTYGLKTPNGHFPAGSPEAGRSWEKCLLGIPERFMLGMLSRGWILRNKIIWHKPNHLPAPIRDRFTNSWEHVFLFTKSAKYYFDLDAVREPHKRGTPKAERDFQRMMAGREVFNGKWSNASSPGIQRSFRGGHPLGKNPGDAVEFPGYVKTSYSDAGDYWNIPTQGYRGAHFAVFPEKLVERAVKTTPREICILCGKPRERIIKTRYGQKTPAPRRGEDPRIAGFRYRCGVEHATVGWTDCGCGVGFRPALVLDPFMGSGTTAKVAKSFGRDFLGFEKNPEYVKLAEERLTSVKPMSELEG